MNLKWMWYSFEKVIADTVCDQMIDLLKQSKKSRGTIGAFKDKKELTKQEQRSFDKTRKSHVFFSNLEWLYRYTHPWIHEANKKAGWNVQWSLSEECQLTQYGPKEFYDWHVDAWPEGYKGGAFDGLIRKLSSTLVLNDATEYTGGKLEFWNRPEWRKDNYTTSPSILKKGSIIVFPSFVFHRVTPVTKGIRYSLTNWHCGKPYV